MYVVSPCARLFECACSGPICFCIACGNTYSGMDEAVHGCSIQSNVHQNRVPTSIRQRNVQLVVIRI